MERKEAIEIVRKLYNKSMFLKKDKEAMVTLIPELKEIEDEKIRKAIIDFFSEPCRKEYILNGFTVDDIIAWLEKHSSSQTKE